MKRITVQAKDDLSLADALEAKAREIRARVKGGNTKLTALMTKRGLQDRALADAVGTTLQAVYYWRRGLRLPSKATLDALKEFLKCDAGAMGFDEAEIQKRRF